MATVIGPDDLGKDSSDRTNQSVGSPPPQGGNVGTPGPSAPPTSGANPNKTLGSGYTNIQKIVQANQGNQLGQTVGQGIQQAGGNVQNQLGQAQNQFQQQTQQNQANTGANQQLVQNVLNNPNQYVSGQVNGNQGNQFSQLISGQYAGPQGLQNAQTLQSRAQNVGQMGQALGTASGRTGLLNQLVGNPQYTQGQQNLDSLLLGQSKDPALAAAKRQALTLGNQVGSAVSGAQAIGQQQANQAQQFGQGIQQQLGGQLSKEEQDLQQNAANLQSKRNAQITALQGQLGQGQVNADMAQQLGIQQGALTYNVDPSKFMNVNPITATEQNVATPQQVAQIQALQKLAGSNSGQQARDIFGRFGGAQTQAGTYANSTPYTMNAPGYQQAYQSAQQNYNNTLNTAQQAVNVAQQDYQSGAARLGMAAAFEPSARAEYQALLDRLNGAKSNLASTQSNLNSEYGTGTYNVNQGQSAYPAVSGIQPIIQGGLETMPTVS